MEISVIGSSQVKIGRNSDGGVGLCSSSSITKNLNNNNNGSKICYLKNNYSGVSLRLSSKSVAGLRLTTSAKPLVRAAAAAVPDGASNVGKTKPAESVKLFVGMPLDTVSSCNTIMHARAIVAGLKALKLLGVDGVELPVWWGVVERDAMGKYDWTSYLAVVDMVQKLGLKVHVSLCFHACPEANIELPQWVSRIGDSVPDLYFKDRSGNQFKDCLSLAVDDIPVLDGKTPLDVYKGFCENFKASFSSFMGSTITDISVGLGPDGELRYPSFHDSSNSHNGAGEFQCYDKNMLNKLKSHAETTGQPLWGLGGPHDAPGYDQSPISGGFFKDNGGSWESQYGDFFLSWYSNELISHGDKVLSLAASTFDDKPVTLSGRIPLMHSWNRTCSHPSELTAGIYNTANRDGYESIAEVFSRNSCRMILPGMDLSDEDQPINSHSSPESLLTQIMSSCEKHGIEVSGHNSLMSGSSRGFEQINQNLLGGNAAVNMFTYQRMGASFFSPNHFRSFSQLVCRLNHPIQSLDDMAPVDVEETANSLSHSNPNLQPV